MDHVVLAGISWDTKSMFGLPLGVVAFGMWMLLMNDKSRNASQVQKPISTPTPVAQTPAVNPGSHTGLSKNDEAILFNDQAVVLDLQGNRDAAMELWTKAALAGVANALASFSWIALKAGRFDDAIELHKECFKRLTIGNDAYQLANCESNYALNLLASTGDLEVSKQIWISKIATKHAESKFYAVLAAHLQGNSQERDDLAKTLVKSDWDEVRKTMFEEKLSSKGWFKDWCSQGLDLIDQMKPTS
jgi:tetratricopeptide (TPR) repeat protein